MREMKKTTIYLLSHSHTDIGFTDRQERIARYHADYIQQLLGVLSQIEEGTHSEWVGYKWTCENYWQVENFYSRATIEDQKRFEHFVHKGWIDVSLNYLNLNDLVDASVLRAKLQDARKWAQSINYDGHSAMVADINGLSWGYADALFDSDITHLYTCIHTHHGMDPAFKKQMPFYWKTPRGNKILVWSGDHYMIGNEFQLVPGNRYSYLRHDHFFGDETTDQYTITKHRIFDYVHELQNEGLEYSFFPVSMSGVRTDNSPSNPRMIETVNRWNEEFGDQIELKVSNLTEFFERVAQEKNIPTFEGDWPDWWADGIASTPNTVKVYKEAQRTYDLAQRLDPDDKLGTPGLMKTATDNMMLYAEHTWGYSASVSNPADSMVNILDYRNASYASVANAAATDNLDQILSHHGAVSPKPYRQKLFCIMNPGSSSVASVATVSLMSWESVDGHPLSTKVMQRLLIKDAYTGKIIPSQTERSLRGFEISFNIRIEANSRRLIVVRYSDEDLEIGNLTGLRAGAEGVHDVLAPDSHNVVSPFHIVNNFFDIKFDNERGLNSLVLRLTDCQIIRQDAMAPAFSGIYEVTKDSNHEPPLTRKLLGRNRKGQNVQRFFSSISSIRIIQDGLVYTDVLITSSLAGTKGYKQKLRIYKGIPRIDCSVEIEKTLELSPENLYISLPFTLGEGTDLSIDKTGCVVRPGIDQLPGTNIQYYLTQHGLRLSKDAETVDVLMKDTPLLWTGSLDAHLFDPKVNATQNQDLLYAWVMNNFWETNFKADLSGCYEFRYSLEFNNSDPKKDTVNSLEDKSNGLLTYRYASDDFGGDYY